MFEAFDRGARRVVIRAQLEAQRRGGIEVARVDVLEALLSADDEVGRLLAEQCRRRPRAADGDVTDGDVTDGVGAGADASDRPGRPGRDAYVGIEVIRATSRQAQVAAMRRGHPVVTAAHLAIAVLEPASVRSDGCLAQRAASVGLDPAGAVAALDAHLARHLGCGGGPPSAAAAPSPRSARVAPRT